MIEINQKKYKLCLFDTNALSAFLQRPEEWIIYFNQEFSLSDTIICYSIFTLSELYYRQELFEKYIEFFSLFPSALLDGHESIFQKEMQAYQKTEFVNPVVLAPCSICGEGLSQKEKLEKVIKKSGFIDKTKYWKNAQEDILEGMIELKKNYPPKNGKYTVKEIEDFNLYASTSQIGMRNRPFAQKILDSGQFIDIAQFPSLKSTSYIVFYKFYPDDRKPLSSDVFDIMISALLPYVDYFLTEGNLYDIIMKIKGKHGFLENIIPYKLKDIRKQIDDRT